MGKCIIDINQKKVGVPVLTIDKADLKTSTTQNKNYYLW